MSNITCSFNQFQSDLCLSGIDGHAYGVILEVVLFLLTFAGLAIAAEHLCNAMETLCDHWSISEEVGGATFIALGGSLPEITINCIATFKARKLQAGTFSIADMGVGAILGSGMIAYLLIPGLCAMLAPRALALRRRAILRDASFYGLALLTLISAVYFGVSHYHAPILLSIYASYVLVLIFADHIHFWWSHVVGSPHLGPTVRNRLQRSGSVFRDKYTDTSSPSYPLLSVPISEDLSIEFPPDREDSAGSDLESYTIVSVFNGLVFPFKSLIDLTCPDCRIFKPNENLYLVTFLMSFAWITFFSFLITIIVNRWVELLNMPSASALIGLVIVAIGAEIPDGVNSVTISRRGFGDMAISACLGAQVINICLGLGLPWIIMTISGGTIPISSTSFFVHEATIVLLIAVVLFVIVATSGKQTFPGSDRFELGGFKSWCLLAWYIGSVSFLGYTTTSRPSIPSN
jgi:Ca2+/Na+ antiporter